MPSVSRAQHNFFEAIAHSASFAKKAGVSQQVGKDFAAADKARGKAAVAKLPARKPKTTMEKYR